MWMKSKTKITVSKTRNQIKWSLLPFQSAPKVGKERLRNRGLKLCCIKITKWNLLKKITNQTLKYQLLWQSLKTKTLAYGTKRTASLPQSAPYRPPLSLNGIPATLARFQCLAITESQHRLVPCVSPPWTLLPASLPLISHLQVLFWTPLSWQVPPVLSDISNTHDSIIAMIYIYVTV